MNKNDLLFGLLSFGGGLAAISARLGYQLFRIDVNPPENAEQANHWHRKRRWLAISELLGLPFFTIAAVSITIYWSLPPITSVLISMIFGALGFGLLLDALQFFFKKKMGLTP